MFWIVALFMVDDCQWLQAQGVRPKSAHGWASVAHGGQTVSQHWIKVLCLLGYGWVENNTYDTHIPSGNNGHNSGNSP